ncbi:uncharacterized protein LOC132729884 [Ruditapes philippinarum]|uniref:uncharacterized protein LOC132729884 n=1 Tax=Ruditapes philippinarum TaxID=129788 RepID=UPI00295B7434|nr:uncharacterized protein LOC132729884 [Ruditapes philippinarum]
MNVLKSIKSLIPSSLPKNFRSIIGFPGLTLKSCKEHVSVLPVHFFTIGGGVVCALYLLTMASYKDTSLSQYSQADISPSDKAPIYISPTRTDLQGQKMPEAKPKLLEE